MMRNSNLRSFPIVLILLLSFSAFAQVKPESSRFTILVKDGRFIISGVVDSKETKEKILTALMENDPVLAEEKIVVNESAEPFPDGWLPIVLSEIRKVKKWNTGLYSYSSDKEEEVRNFMRFVAASNVVEVEGTAPTKLLDPAKRVTLINLFAVWAGPSRSDLPVLNGLYEKYGRLGLDVVAIHVDEDDPKQRIIDFKRELGLRFRVAVLSSELVNWVTRISRFNGVPQTVVLRDAKIEGIFRGAGREENKKLVDLVKSFFPQ